MTELPSADSIRPPAGHDFARRLEADYLLKEQGLGVRTKTLSSVQSGLGAELRGPASFGALVPARRNKLSVVNPPKLQRRAHGKNRLRLGMTDDKTDSYFRTCKRDGVGRCLPYEPGKVQTKAIVKKKDSLDRTICHDDVSGKRVPCNPTVPARLNKRPPAPKLPNPPAKRKAPAPPPAPQAPAPSEVAPQKPVTNTPPPPDPTANRPSKPEERDPNAKLPVLPWKSPPPPKALYKGKGKVVRPKGKFSNTARGDKVEAMAEKLNLRSILPPTKKGDKIRRANTNVGEEGSSIDREYDHSGKLCEIKACWTTATEYKAKPKKAEFDDVTGKGKYAKMHHGDPVTVIAVVDDDAGIVHYYWHEGLTTKKLIPGDDPRGWNYMGSVRMG